MIRLMYNTCKPSNSQLYRKRLLCHVSFEQLQLEPCIFLTALKKEENNMQLTEKLILFT